MAADHRSDSTGASVMTMAHRDLMVNAAFFKLFGHQYGLDDKVTAVLLNNGYTKHTIWTLLANTKALDDLGIEEQECPKLRGAIRQFLVDIGGKKKGKWLCVAIMNLLTNLNIIYLIHVYW